MAFDRSEFSDLKSDLEEGLTAITDLPDMEQMIGKMNQWLQTLELSTVEKLELRRLRQRAYDRKKQLKPTFPEKEPGPTLVFPSTMQAEDTETPPLIEQANEIQEEIPSQAPIFFLKPLFNFLCKLLFTALVVCLLWEQSLPLYKSSGFPEPTLAALGAIVMIVGFAILHSRTHSKLTLLLCLYAGGYEAMFIGAGTFKDESVEKQKILVSQPELVWLQEQTAKAKASYDEVKKRYDEPTSKVFKNGWYKKNFVEPVWEQYSTLQASYLSKLQIEKAASQSFDYIGMLKLVYRLGIVFLCMMLVHRIGLNGRRHFMS